MQLSCSNPECGYKFCTYSDKQCNEINRKKQGRHPYEINIRTIIGFREVGHGHSSIENVLRCMNIHSISSSSFTCLNEQVACAYSNVAAESMQNAAADVRALHPVTLLSKAPHPMCRVSVDGSWQKRGHVSLHGVVTAISESKCVDFHVLTKYCRQCRIWERKRLPRIRIMEICT